MLVMRSGVAQGADALKSASANLGAMSLAEMRRQVEDIARGNSVHGCNSLISDLAGIRQGERGAKKRSKGGFVDDSLSRNKSPVALVVDDDRGARLLAGARLEESGFMVEQASDGIEALEAFERFKPSIVLLDVVMPGMDGFTACREIRNLPDGRHIPVLMMTGLDDKESLTVPTMPVPPTLLPNRSPALSSIIACATCGARSLSAKISGKAR